MHYRFLVLAANIGTQPVLDCIMANMI